LGTNAEAEPAAAGGFIVSGSKISINGREPG